MNNNVQLIDQFYTAFANQDGRKMSNCYHPDIQFQDTAFGILNGQNVSDMWNMLLERSKGNLKIEFYNVKIIEDKGSATWIATYNFSKTNRKVVNIIQASFEFKDGLIYKHTDSFNLWEWSQQALGWKGLVLGWTSFMQRKIREQAIISLKNYQNKK